MASLSRKAVSSATPAATRSATEAGFAWTSTPHCRTRGAEEGYEATVRLVAFRVTMSTVQQISPISTVARVRVVGHDDRRLYLEFRNGLVVTMDVQDPLEFNVGSVVLVRQEDDYIEVAPDELWPEESWVGVVRLKLEDTTVVDSSGHWRMLPTRTDVAYREGNTVEALDSHGVVRVLSEKPIRYHDPPTVDDDVISKFKSQGGGKQDVRGLRRTPGRG